MPAWPCTATRHPADDHGIFEWPTFYEVEVNGEKFVDWVTRLIEGEPIDDVHCEDCGTP